MPFLQTGNRIAVKGAEVNRLKKFFCFLAILFVSWMAASPLRAFETEFRGGPVTIEADSIAYDGDEDVFHAEGKVLITFTGGFLKADAANLNRTTSQALAVGHVLVRSDQDILEGEKVSFNTVSRTGMVEVGKMFIAQNHFYIQGERIEKKSEATYRLENATVTTCDGDAPDWRIAGSELDLTVDGYGVLKHGRFLARDLPLLYIPYLIFPAKTTRQTGLLFPRFAYSRDQNGLDVEIPFYWAVSDSADATFFQRYLEKRGFKEGVEIRYFTSPDSFGVFYGDFINDRKRVTDGVGTMSRDWQDDRNRWSYYLNHETTFADGINLRSDIRRVSDRWYFKDFSYSNYYRDHYSPSGEERFSRVSFLGDESLGSLDSTVRLTKDWSLYNLTALARYTDDFSAPDNNGTLQKYPEATLTGFRQPLFNSPLQLEFTAGYDHFFRQEGQKGHLWQISPTLFLPLKLGSYARMTPQAGFRGDVWERSDSAADAGDKYGDREVFTLGTTLSTEISRVFDVNGAEVEKIRHGIRPEITYTYIPDTSQDHAPDFLDRIPGQHTLTYGITNTLLTRMRAKDGKISYREMMRFKIGQTYDIREAGRDVTGSGKDNQPFSDVDLELDLAPLPYFSLSARNKYDVNSGNWRQSNYDLTLSDHRGDSMSAGYRYTRDTLEEINLYLRAVLTSSLGATYVLRRNQFDGRTVESTCGLQYRKQCWNVELNVSDRVDDRAVMVVFSLYGMGK
ncbi:MAG: LPS assembly protein LptD [Deltaproteobacteria bacterium]|nr:LPS assembly protein LptD [Deltaproteobacteria bacterium]